jgi:Domain of unknown function (DUF4037)
MNKVFTPGLQLAGDFYLEIILPLLENAFPGLAHAAGLIDGGSEALGFDDEISMDHHWGPRLTLFLSEENHPRYAEQITRFLANNLPYEFKGYPTNFTQPDPGNNGVQTLQPITHGTVNHRVSIQTVRIFFNDYLDFDIGQPMEPADWLTFSEQRLRTISTGTVFHDDLNLEEVRSHFAWYPQDVWLYLLAATWRRIGQEEHLMGRAGMVADEVGSALIGARLVRDIMRLCFLMEKTYAPYPKWFGSAFKQLACAPTLWPVLQQVLRSETWQVREKQLVQAYEYIAARHNELNLTTPLPEKVTTFHERPFKVIALYGFAEALLGKLQDPEVKRIAERPLIGNIDLFSDNVDLLSSPYWRRYIRNLYE